MVVTNQSYQIKEVYKYVVAKLQSVDAGHNVSHVERVLYNAKLINEVEKADEFLVEMGVLLHDVTDEKFFDKKNAESELMTFLVSIHIKTATIRLIFDIINAVSFGGEFDAAVDLTIEQKVVRDADRLDAIGAIGIARAFHYGGSKDREIFNPNIPPQKYQSTKEYRQSNAPTINHFYEKLLLLKDRMETRTGQIMAKQRHQFLVEYLAQFYEETGVKGFGESLI